jgi:hypothetical protein
LIDINRSFFLAKVYKLAAVFFCTLISFLMFSCNIFVENGGLGTSLNIEDSKQERYLLVNIKQI